MPANSAVTSVVKSPDMVTVREVDTCLNAFRAVVQVEVKEGHPVFLNSLGISEQPRRLDRACLHVKVACDLLAVIGKPQAVLHDFLHGVNDRFAPTSRPPCSSAVEGGQYRRTFGPPIIIQRDFQFGTEAPARGDGSGVRRHLQIGESNGHVEFVPIELWETRLHAGKERREVRVEEPRHGGALAARLGTGDPSA